MNKKIILILTLTLTIFLMISTVSASNMFDFFNSNSANLENTDEKFIIGFNSEFPPFGYVADDKNYTGFDIELAKEVCKRNNWTFIPLPIIDWNTKELELNSDEVDCIWSEFTINGREDNYTWSKPYFNNTPVVIVKSNSNINSFNDLKGKSIEIEDGTSVLNKIKENSTLNSNFNKITEVDNYDTALIDLESGVCDAVIADYGIANYIVVEKYPDCKILNETLPNEHYGIGFKKGNTELRDQVQKTLDEMFKDGTVDKIAQNYSKYNLPERVIHP
ncbi:transporter substrate-binding domain-containing protein [Methanobrevibacter sp.]|uniref:transporter substrate-binding domain-containing protein n=1 Tax=Methanobrevibacter sp. TaxID=66852 RepID=UPI00386598EA